ELQKFVDGGPVEGPGLNMVIPCIPDRFDEDVTNEIKRSLLGQVAGYRRIFLGEADETETGAGQAPRAPGGRLIDEMDTLITGVGTASKTSTDPWLIERVNAMHNDPALTREDFEACTFGDISGVYLLRPDLAALIASRLGKPGGAGKGARDRGAIEAKVRRI